VQLLDNIHAAAAAGVEASVDIHLLNQCLPDQTQHFKTRREMVLTSGSIYKVTNLLIFHRTTTSNIQLTEKYFSKVIILKALSIVLKVKKILILVHQSFWPSEQYS